jgi:hypothetical protein
MRPSLPVVTIGSMYRHRGRWGESPFRVGCALGARHARVRGMFFPRKIILVIYVVIGVVIASTHHYLSNLDSIRRFASAVLAILLWPLILLGIDLHIRK